MRRSPLIATIAAVLLLGAACSTPPDARSEATTSSPSAAEPAEPSTTAADETGEADSSVRPELLPAAAGTVVLPAPDPATAALSTSQGLFATSPVVVLAEAADPGALATASRRATGLGVPLLLTTGVSTTADGPLAAELERLGTTHALAIGVAAREAAARLDGLTVTANAGTLPAVTRPDPVAGTTVLAGSDSGGAALATATSAGAATLTVPTGDPRADPAVIEALAAEPPTRVLALGEQFGTADLLGPRVASAVTGAQLPGGGQLVLADRTYVALYGHPGTAALGLLGEQDLPAAIARAHDLARDHRPHSDLPVLPTFEIITTVASAGAGGDGNYSNEIDPETLRPWVEEAGRQGVYVLLDLQPGTTDFLTQAKRYETLLAYPHVGLALDPEWRLEPGQRHMEQIGSVSAAEVNSVSAWLAALVRERSLPQKMLVLHQFRTTMITDRASLDTTHDEVAVVIHADGNGSQGAKAATWSRILADAPAGVSFAWKNFVDEDSPMLTPGQTMAIRPTPVLVTYQ